MENTTIIDFTKESAVKICDSDLACGTVFLQKNFSLDEHEYLNVRIYSENNSQIMVKLLAGTGKASDNCGYCFFFNVSFTGCKTLSFPIKKGVITLNTPVCGYDNISYLGIDKNWCTEPNPVKTVLYIEKIWLSDQPECESAPEENIVADTNYFVPSEEKGRFVSETLKKLYPENKHPRMILTDEKVTYLKSAIKTVPFVTKAFKKFQEECENDIKAPVYGYQRSDFHRLDRKDAILIHRLGLISVLSNDERYFERLKKEVYSVCGFCDFNPLHDLDVGDYVRPLAFAYDWLYDKWSESERRMIRNALMEKGVMPMISALRTQTWFAGDRGNHNTVVSSGLGLIPLAFGDEDGYEAISEEVVNLTVSCIPKNLETFAPYGVCVEGAAYWAYGQNNFYLYQASLFSALGTDFRLSEVPGMKETGDFITAMLGPFGRTFNYADGGSGLELTPSTSPASLLWLAKLYNKPEYAVSHMDFAERNNFYTFEDLLYFVPEFLNIENPPAKDCFFGNIGALRSSSDKDAFYIGFKGGKPAPHMDLDFGTFVFDAYGERWVCDLGSEEYDAPGFWNYDENAGRWNYYRKRAEGNNTIVINPEKCTTTADMNPNCDSHITACHSSEEVSYASIILRGAYPKYAKHINRRYTLDKTNKTFCLDNEIELNEKSDIYMYFHTEADCKISGNTATLEKNGKKIELCVSADADFSMYLSDAEPLLEKFRKYKHKDNSNFKKIVIYLKETENASIHMTFK